MAIYLGNKKIGKIFKGDKQIKNVYLGDTLVYSSKPKVNAVIYYVNSGVSYTEDVTVGESVLSPTSFTPTLSGWTFVGWRQDTTAGANVLTELVMGKEPITLYAVFKQPVTLSYNGNGGSGSVAAESKDRYYNNGNVVNPAFTVKTNGFTKTAYSFVRWRLNGTSGTAYSPNATLALSANAILYAEWTYSGAPFYVIQSGVCKQTLTWTQTSSNNADGIGVQNDGARLVANLTDNTKNGQFTMRSDSISTKGNKTLKITGYAGSQAGTNFTVNGVTKSIAVDGASEAIFDISSVSNFTITAQVNAWAYHAMYFTFGMIYLY